LSLHDVGGGVQGDALGVVAVRDLAKHLAHLDGSAAPLLAAAVGAGGGLLADEGGGGHLAAGHAVNGVVDEDNGDLLAAVGGVDDLVGADGSEVTIALVGEHAGVRVNALDTGGDSGGAAVRGL